MIRTLLKHSPRLYHLRFLCLLTLALSLPGYANGFSAGNDIWAKLLFISLGLWTSWSLLSLQAGYGWAMGNRSSNLMQSLPIPTRDLWLASLFIAWIEFMVPAVGSVAVALLLTSAPAAEAPSFILRYGICASFTILLYQLKGYQYARTPASWHSKALAGLGLAIFGLVMERGSIAASMPLLPFCLGFGLWTWRRLPQSFLPSTHAQHALQRSTRQAERSPAGSEPPWTEAAFILRLHRPSLLLPALLIIPATGFVFPWFGASHHFLGFSVLIMVLPFYQTLRLWKSLVHFPLEPRRFLLLNTLPVWMLFAAGYLIGSFTRGGAPDSQVQPAVPLLLHALAYFYLAAIPLGRLRRPADPEETFTVLGSTPRQLLVILFFLAATVAFVGILIFRPDLLKEAMQSLVIGISGAIPFGEAGGWIALAVLIPTGGISLSRRFRRFDLGSGIRL